MDELTNKNTPTLADITGDMSLDTSDTTPAPQIRIVFMGTPALSAELLQHLLERKYNIVGVVTKPDKPVGRDQSLLASPVKKIAEEHAIPVFTPQKIDTDAIATIKKLEPDLILVAAYGKILPAALLEIPGFGCLNVHYSLLPRFRGASPIQHSLLFGDQETGVTLMKMDVGLDTGDIIATKKLPIEESDTTLSLTPKLSALAKELLQETLPLWVKQRITATPQPADGVVLCQLIEREDGKIIWDAPAQEIYNRYRAFTPWPGVFCYWKKKDAFVRIKLTSFTISQNNHEVPYRLGEVFQTNDGTAVQTGDGIVLLQEIQPEGKAVMPLKDFLNGNPDFIGALLV